MMDECWKDMPEHHIPVSSLLLLIIVDHYHAAFDLAQHMAGLKHGEMNLNLFSAAIFARVNRNDRSCRRCR